MLCLSMVTKIISDLFLLIFLLFIESRPKYWIDSTDPKIDDIHMSNIVMQLQFQDGSRLYDVITKMSYKLNLFNNNWRYLLL